MDTDFPFSEASRKTAAKLRPIAQSSRAQSLSHLTLPEIDAAVDQTARAVPAGNIPALILSGLVRLPGRKLPQETVRQDINLLFKGIEQTLDTALYGAFFAGPAAVIWGYQSLLKLSGREPDDAFPEGSWQFYVNYAMRDDTARHSNETHGFDTFLNQHQLHLTTTDRITVWVMAAIHCLHQYQALLTNEWRERVHTHLLVEVTKNEPDPTPYTQLYRNWESQRPYGRGPDATPDEIYPDYRRRKFDQFLVETMRNLRADLHHAWTKRVYKAESESLSAYQRQMSILAYLDPGPYGEIRTPLPLKRAHIGLIHRGGYYLIPACVSGTNRPLGVQSVRAKVATMLADSAGSPAQLSPLAGVKREAWPRLHSKLSGSLLQQLDTLRQTPILLNCDRQRHNLPLAEVRRAERGRGDHALTIFDTGQTFIFDQSHIFFDAVWGAALAEIMTQEAIVWARHLSSQKLSQPSTPRFAQALTFDFSASDLEAIRQCPRITAEASAETDSVDIKAIRNLRRLFKQRNDLIQLTVNDLLILYRAIHAVTYRPDPELVETLKQLAQGGATQPAAAASLEALARHRQRNPSIVMPVDAGRNEPRDRLHPVTFEVPLQELDLLTLHQQVIIALDAYKNAGGDRTRYYADFDQRQRAYLATLAGFGEFMNKVKEIAAGGQSFSVSTIKLLAHIPPPLQRMLEKMPNSIDMLNDLTRGRENFSNVGAVAADSTLTRFLSAKDDNEKKTLIWGVMTDAQGVMRISLRDFRPHVDQLTAVGRKDLAGQITRHYLEAYATGLNAYIYDLQRITQTSRETRPQKPEERYGR